MFSESLVEVIATSTVLPTVADAAVRARIIEHPDVAGAGFSSTGGEFFDRGFVELKIALGKALLMDRFGDGPEQLKALERPMVQGIARGVEAEALEDCLLPVDGKVVGVFGDDEFGGEAEGGHSSGERAGGCRSDER